MLRFLGDYHWAMLRRFRWTWMSGKIILDMRYRIYSVSMPSQIVCMCRFYLNKFDLDQKKFLQKKCKVFWRFLIPRVRNNLINVIGYRLDLKMLVVAQNFTTKGCLEIDGSIVSYQYGLKIVSSSEIDCFGGAGAMGTKHVGHFGWARIWGWAHVRSKKSNFD